MAKKTSVEERRRFVRLNISVEIQYTVLEKETPDELKAKSRNISAGGICIIADEKIATDNILILSIYLPADEMPIIAKGKVVWARPFEIGKEGERFDVGVEFIEIDPKDRKKIDQYVFSSKKS